MGPGEGGELEAEVFRLVCVPGDVLDHAHREKGLSTGQGHDELDLLCEIESLDLVQWVAFWR